MNSSTATPSEQQLTPRQTEIYRFIREMIRGRGYGPTVREIGAHFGIRSPNGVMCHLKALEKRGCISRAAFTSRGIQLIEGIANATELPLEGEVQAGLPVEATRVPESVDLGFLLGPDQFALRVKGDSMIEDHIAAGDLVIVRRHPLCRDGDVVVALIGGTEATLKRFYREGGRVRLEPANSQMQPIYVRDVEILGVVVAVLRRP